MPLPESIAHYDYRRSAGPVLRLPECPSKRRLHAQDSEEVPGDSHGGKLLRVSSPGQIKTLAGKGGELRKRVALRAQILKTSPGKRPQPERPVFVFDRQQYQSVGLRKRKRAQQQG